MVNRTTPASRRRRRRDPGATRDALLAAGTALFAERGYDGVPVAAIAEKAGVNKAMINYHFGGKRRLYRTIVQATFSEIVAQAERLPDSPDPAPEVLRELVRLIAETATARNPHFPTMMLREALTGGRRLDREIIDYPRRVADVVRRILERGVREGAFRPVDPLLTHLTVIGSLLFFFATAHLRDRVLADGPGRPSLPADIPGTAAYVTHTADLLIHGLAMRPRGTNGGRPRGNPR